MDQNDRLPTVVIVEDFEDSTHLGWSARASPRAPARAFDRFQLD